VVLPGWAWLFFGIFLAAAWSHVAVREGSSWSARSRAAARTNELDAGWRRRIMRSGEDLSCGVLRVLVLSPAWLAQWPGKHPSGAAGVRAAAMTMCPGTGLLS